MKPSINSIEASVFLQINRFLSFIARRSKYWGKYPRRCLLGIFPTRLASPPSSPDFSIRTVAHPTSAAVHAASRPAVPPPTTTTLHGFFNFLSLYNEPEIRAGLMLHLIGSSPNVAVHPLLHEIQRLISSVLPNWTLFTHSGSAISPRPIAIRSASPSSRIRFATSGSRILPLVWQGFPVFSLIDLDI